MEQIGHSQINDISEKFNIKMYSACLDYIIDNSIFNGNNLSEEVITYTKNFIECCGDVGISFIILPLLEKSVLTPDKVDLVKLFLHIVSLECSKFKIQISIESIAPPELILKVLSEKPSDKIGCVYDTGNKYF